MTRLLLALVFALAGCAEGPSWSVQVDEVGCEDLDYSEERGYSWTVPEGAVVQSVQVCAGDACKSSEWKHWLSTSSLSNIDCGETVVVTYLLPVE